jgi:hypothetical protein
MEGECEKYGGLKNSARIVQSESGEIVHPHNLNCQG